MSTPPEYAAIYAFGDSLSDAGNAYLLTNSSLASLLGITSEPVSPPYYQEVYTGATADVFSNGPVWTQDLSLALGLGTLAPAGVGMTANTLQTVLTAENGSTAAQIEVGALELADHITGNNPYLTVAEGGNGGTDYAIGGAVTGVTAENTGAQVALTDLSAQLGTFQHDVPTPEANALATISIGSNDVLNLLEEPDFSALFGSGTTLSDVAATPAGQDVAQSVSIEAGFLSSLDQSGLTNQLVLNVPNLGETPEITELYPTEDAAATVLSQYYDSLLTTDVASLDHSGANIVIDDAYSLLDNAIANPGSYALQNVSSPVWSGSFTSDASGNLVSSNAATQNTYLFFDHLHPTETGQTAVEQSALQALETSPPGVVLQGPSSQFQIAADGASLYVNNTVAGGSGTQVLPGVTLMNFTNGIGLFDPTGSAEDVARLYLAALDRQPDLGGLEYWTAQIDDLHVPLSAIANDFASSPEFIQDYGTLSNSAFVSQLYQNVLDRPADPSGLQYWESVLGQGASRGQVLLGFSQSNEFEADTISTAGDTNNAEVYRIYEAGLGRAPDPSGLTNWTAQLAAGATPVQVAQSITGSAEFQQKYGGLSPTDFITDLYQNVLHRAPDPSGLQSWTTYLQKGGTDAGVVIGFADSVENRALTSAATHANWVFIPT